MVTAHFSFSQIMKEHEEEAREDTGGWERREKFEMQIFVVWLKASRGDICSRFMCVV